MKQKHREDGCQVYIADSGTYHARKIDRNGIISTIAGNGKETYNGDGILATKASGIFVDNDSQIYIADSHNHCIRKIDQYGMISTIVGTPCVEGFSGNVPFDFQKYPHIGPKKKPKIKPFPKAYHDIVILQ